MANNHNNGIEALVGLIDTVIYSVIENINDNGMSVSKRPIREGFVVVATRNNVTVSLVCNTDTHGTIESVRVIRATRLQYDLIRATLENYHNLFVEDY